MSEKPPVNFDLSQDASIEELQSLVDQGLPESALKIVKFKLGELETVMADIDKIVRGEEGEISREQWQEAKVDIVRQIYELKDFLDKIKV